MKVPPVKLISDWIGGAPAPRIGTRSCAVPTLSMIASTTPLDTYQSPMPPSASVPPKRSAVLPEVSCRAVGSAGPPHSATVVRRRAPVAIFIEDLLRTRSRRRAAYLRRALRVKGGGPELSSLSDFVPLKRSVKLSSPLAWKGDGPDERGTVEAVGCDRPAARRQADVGTGGPGPRALRAAGAASAGAGGEGRAAGTAARQYGPRADAHARAGGAEADRSSAAEEVRGLQRRAFHREAGHRDAAAAGFGRLGAADLAGGRRTGGLAPSPPPAPQAPRAQGASGPDAVVGRESARLAGGPRAVVVPGWRDRRCDGRAAPRRTLRRPRVRRRLSARAARDRDHLRAAGEHLHGPARRAQAQR